MIEVPGQDLPADAAAALALDREKRLFALCVNLRVAEVQDSEPVSKEGTEMKLSRILWITGGCLAVLAGCSSTKTMVVPSADLSGFLSGYTELRRGGDGEPAHVYRKPGWNVALYDQVILEPIEIWRGEESRRKGQPAEETQYLADYFYTLIYMRLARDYEMVTEAGPSTMRIRVGLSKVGEEAMQRDALSITTARPNLIPQFKKVAKQPADFVGTATVEAEFSDAQTQEVFWAGIERRSVETTGEADYGWSDVEAELKFLAERLGYRLCVDRGDDACAQPVRGR